MYYKAVGLFIVILALTILTSKEETAPHVPSCMEDELAWGIGDFESEGWYETYICLHYEQLYENIAPEVYELGYMDGYADADREQSFGGDFPQIEEPWSSTPIPTPSPTPTPPSPTPIPPTPTPAPVTSSTPTLPCATSTIVSPIDETLTRSAQIAADAWNKWFKCIQFSVSSNGLPISWSETPCGIIAGACWLPTGIEVNPKESRPLASVLMHELGHTIYSHKEVQPEAPNVMSEACWATKSSWVTPNDEC